MPKPEAIPAGIPSTVNHRSHRIWLEENGADKIKLLNNPMINKFGFKKGLSKKLSKMGKDFPEKYRLLKFEFINCGIATLK